MGHRTLVTLFDLSETTRREAIRESYLESLQRVAEALEPGDAFLAAGITANTAGEVKIPVAEVVPRFDPGTDNPLIVESKRAEFDQRLEEARRRIVESVGPLLLHQQRGTRFTDILGALELAARAFEQYPAHERALILFSDMVQDAEGIDFDVADLSEEGRARLLGRLEGNGRIVRLDGVEVYVVGARNPDLRRQREIRDFWVEYFHRTGARLDPSRYGAALLRFP